MKKFQIHTMMAGSWVGEYESKEAAEIAAGNADLKWGNGNPSFTVEEIESSEAAGLTASVNQKKSK